jgi:hypothetical protein
VILAAYNERIWSLHIGALARRIWLMTVPPFWDCLALSWSYSQEAQMQEHVFFKSDCVG